MQHPASSQHSLNNLQQENRLKANSNQKALFAKLVNLKLLLTGSLLLLLLAACGGETSNNDKTGNNGDETPGIDKCETQPTTEGCPEITNSHLTEDKLKNGVKNFIISPRYLIKDAYQSGNGEGIAIKEVIYGTIDELGKKFTPATFSNAFKEATTEADKKDDDKNNIIKISTGKADESASDNYYYSHIGGKHFTQFLPSINKMEILALNSARAVEDDPDNNIFFDNDLRLDTLTLGKLKVLVKKAKDYTFKGFALVEFRNYDASFTIENDLYPGSFELTFNSKDVYSKQNVAEVVGYNYFSMKIELDQEAAEATTPSDNGVNPQVAAKPAVKTIEIENFNFLKDEESSANFRSYPSNSNTAINWSYEKGYEHFFTFSENQGKIEQIAGLLYLSRLVAAKDSDPGHLQDMRIAYASNEVCFSGTSDAGTAACPKVKLTGE